ncbi:putative hydrolase/acyltransferase [Gaiella occulta]|uniref:Putative hydrolase/acyltransferase n=1 Tax=Gaiella occulta TaxID=1002870 RepID=A0A7M2YXA9_9ACTN|nr:alpha/beta hydrolase [Gaiella occulta]RDI74370.1 putative hydrolase/acyltransferase [Gaiella occulta]
MTRHVRTADGCRICYDEAGSGDPLILIHGFAQSAAVFGAQLEALAGRNRVIVPDLRGHGRSDKPSRGYRIARLAADVRELIFELGLTRVSLLGWSMGCAVVWSYWDLFGADRLHKLVLVDQSAMLVNRKGWTLGFLDPDQLFRQSDAIRADYPSWARGLTDLIAAGLPDSRKELLVEESLRLPTEAADALLFDHCANDWRDVIPTITVPTLVIGAKQSPVPADAMRWIASSIAGATLALFEMGHFMFIEEAEDFNRVVGDFLASAESHEERI